MYFEFFTINIFLFPLICFYFMLLVFANKFNKYYNFKTLSIYFFSFQFACTYAAPFIFSSKKVHCKYLMRYDLSNDFAASYCLASVGVSLFDIYLSSIAFYLYNEHKLYILNKENVKYEPNVRNKLNMKFIIIWLLLFFLFMYT